MARWSRKGGTRGLRRKKRFEVFDEKGLMVVAIIPAETNVELVVMGCFICSKENLGLL
ncbi:hypothetical protein GQ55_3G323800 [Panicum hallii var. hallii]|uniref:Uncharacterized protein n=1 Tax=Panicum hallii var. hallii TaxID=1504633 RepID=A0A2T7EFF6_9POAL|nr:hypothetical protein GQ55_3G323800 [Panicum hallii var. hallii]